MADKVKGRVAWAFYDWANSAFPTVITTFVFATYFTKGVALDPITGTAQWGWALSISALAVALLGPVMGAVADHTGRRKPWLAFFTYACVAASALLWFVKPDPSWVLFALVVMGVANFCFEMAVVFYNAMLPGLVDKSHLGRLSGWAWGLGYIGGLGCLTVALVGFVQSDTPWFGLSREEAQYLRATPVLVALWMGFFALPIFFFTPDTKTVAVPLGQAVRAGVASLRTTLGHVRRYKSIARYLLARMIYTDGLNTLYAFGGIYAGVTFGMDFAEIITFGIAINVVSGVGAFGFAWVDDWIGPKKTVLIALAGVSVLGLALVLAQSKTQFWLFAMPLGLFVGPAQAASRSFMAHLAPKDMVSEMFGLYALSGKATAFVAPLVLAWATLAFDSQRAGMATILVFFALGAYLLWSLPDPTRPTETVQKN
ncbi:MAG: MFS transporter [Magnetovibrio sp.]|nr:MFS transporter [Magnetovibrio sp.]